MIKLMVLTVVAVLLLANVKSSKGHIPVDPVFPRLCWSKWYNRDSPIGTAGDWEDLKDLRIENPELCSRPLGIQAVTVDGNIPAQNTGQKFAAYNTELGFICLNKDQKFGECFDYKVRFRCPCFSLQECINVCQ